MSFVKFQGMLIDAMDENMLVVAALAIFLTIILISVAVIYAVACSQNKNTQMTKLIHVGVALNEWPENETAGDCPRLVLGEYLVNMKDPAGVSVNRLDPRLGWKQRAYSRKYEVSELLRRFTANFESAGMHADPACTMLQMLQGDNSFCYRLGQIVRTSDKKGLRVLRCECWEQDKQDNDCVSVYVDIPQEYACTYQAATGCEAQKLCMTLRYHSRNEV